VDTQSPGFFPARKLSDLREPRRRAVAETDQIGQGIKWQATPIVLLVVIAICLLSPEATSFGSDFTMKGPREELRVPDKAYEPETSSVGVAMHGLIRFYQIVISPAGGPDRCGFRPSCSHYGYQAIQEQGPIVGIMMIGDRQTRCNIFKEPGPDYPLLPNGKLYDPVSNNLLFGK
jgi:putative membrane protein insertion efficiency factor